jgi:transposase
MSHGVCVSPTSLQFSTPRYLGIDEIVFADRERKLKNQKRAVFVDLESGRVLDMLEGNDKKSVANWLSRLRDGHKVRAVAMDFEQTYRIAVSEILPHANIVIDRFHIAQMIQDVVDRVRKTELKIKPLRTSHGEKRGQAAANASAVRHITSLLRYRRRPELTIGDEFEFKNFLQEYPRVADASYAAQEFTKIWDEEDYKYSAQMHFRAWDRRLPQSVRPTFSKFCNLIYKSDDAVFDYFWVRLF